MARNASPGGMFSRTKDKIYESVERKRIKKSSCRIKHCGPLSSSRSLQDEALDGADLGVPALTRQNSQAWSVAPSDKYTPDDTIRTPTTEFDRASKHNPEDSYDVEYHKVGEYPPVPPSYSERAYSIPEDMKTPSVPGSVQDTSEAGSGSISLAGTNKNAVLSKSHIYQEAVTSALRNANPHAVTNEAGFEFSRHGGSGPSSPHEGTSPLQERSHAVSSNHGNGPEVATTRSHIITCEARDCGESCKCDRFGRVYCKAFGAASASLWTQLCSPRCRCDAVKHAASAPY
jgi:hypothetical protein